MQNTDPARPSITDEFALFAWASTALPGTRAIYHVGHLACDRSPDMSNLAATARARLNSVAHQVMVLVEQGALLAVQQRLDDGRFAYFAVVRTRPRVARARFATAVLGTNGESTPAVPHCNQEVA